MSKRQSNRAKSRFAAILVVFFALIGPVHAEQPIKLVAGQPVSNTLSVSFADGSVVFRPNTQTANILQSALYAAMVTINGRTSTSNPSPKDEALALSRALSARAYLVRAGVSPLKIMVNYASAVDFIADNSTREGRLINQRVDIQLIFVNPRR